MAESESHFYIYIRPPVPAVLSLTANGRTKLSDVPVGDILDVSRLQEGKETVLYCALLDAKYHASSGRQRAGVDTKLVCVMDILELNGKSLCSETLMTRLDVLRKCDIKIKPHRATPVSVCYAQYRSSKATDEFVKQIVTPGQSSVNRFYTIKANEEDSWTVETRGCMFVYKNEPFSTPCLAWDAVEFPQIPVTAIMTGVRLTRDPRKRPPPPPPASPTVVSAISTLLTDLTPTLAHLQLPPPPLPTLSPVMAHPSSHYYPVFPPPQPLPRHFQYVYPSPPLLPPPPPPPHWW